MCALSASLNPSAHDLPGWNCFAGLSSTAVCVGSTSNWVGVRCKSGVVTALLLGGLNLEGKIPSEVGLLMGLDRLELQSNRITGSIPTSVGGAISLTYLNVLDNSLVWAIPNTIGLLSGLRYLNLGRNFLTGSIPSSLCLLSSMSYLNADNNNLVCYKACLSTVATRIFGTGVGVCTDGKRLSLPYLSLTAIILL